jgi:hypothetical protein
VIAATSVAEGAAPVAGASVAGATTGSMGAGCSGAAMALVGAAGTGGAEGETTGASGTDVGKPPGEVVLSCAVASIVVNTMQVAIRV